jgi:hypothetical protein
MAKKKITQPRAKETPSTPSLNARPKKFTQTTYVWAKGGLLAGDSVAVTTFYVADLDGKLQQSYVTKVESVPVFTYRGGKFARDIVAIEKDKTTALEAHRKIVRGEK